MVKGGRGYCVISVIARAFVGVFLGCQFKAERCFPKHVQRYLRVTSRVADACYTYSVVVRQSTLRYFNSFNTFRRGCVQHISVA